MVTQDQTKENKFIFAAITAAAVAILLVNILTNTSSSDKHDDFSTMSDMSAERYYLICAIASNQQVSLKYYGELRDTMGDSDLRARIASITDDIEESFQVSVDGYNASMQKYARAEAQRHNLQYELTPESGNSCTYE